MSFETDLKSHLQSGSAVSAIVDDRIYPVVVKEGSQMPAAVYSFPFGQTENSLDGFTSGVVRYRVQIDCWALTYRQVVLLALAIRDRMNVSAASFKSLIISYPSFDDYEPETKRYRRTMEFSCSHTE